MNIYILFICSIGCAIALPQEAPGKVTLESLQANLTSLWAALNRIESALKQHISPAWPSHPITGEPLIGGGSHDYSRLPHIHQGPESREHNHTEGEVQGNGSFNNNLNTTETQVLYQDHEPSPRKGIYHDYPYPHIHHPQDFTGNHIEPREPLTGNSSSSHHHHENTSGHQHNYKEPRHVIIYWPAFTRPGQGKLHGQGRQIEENQVSGTEGQKNTGDYYSQGRAYGYEHHTHGGHRHGYDGHSHGGHSHGHGRGYYHSHGGIKHGHIQGQGKREGFTANHQGQGERQNHGQIHGQGDGKGTGPNEGEGQEEGQIHGQEDGKGYTPRQDQGKRYGFSQGRRYYPGEGRGGGSGYGYGQGEGEGNGYAPGQGEGNGYASGQGEGNGYAPGQGDGHGYGYGQGDGEGKGYAPEEERGEGRGYGYYGENRKGYRPSYSDRELGEEGEYGEGQEFERENEQEFESEQEGYEE